MNSIVFHEANHAAGMHSVRPPDIRGNEIFHIGDTLNVKDWNQLSQTEKYYWHLRQRGVGADNAQAASDNSVSELDYVKKHCKLPSDEI